MKIFFRFFKVSKEKCSVYRTWKTVKNEHKRYRTGEILPANLSTILFLIKQTTPLFPHFSPLFHAWYTTLLRTHFLLSLHFLYSLFHAHSIILSCHWKMVIIFFIFSVCYIQHWVLQFFLVHKKHYLFDDILLQHW